MLIRWEDVAVIVKTVPQVRRLELAALQSQLKEFGIDHRLACAEAGEQPRDNFRRMLRMALEWQREWTLHLEDDVYLAPTFPVAAMHCINRGIANIWTFYDARKEALHAFEAGGNQRRITPGTFSNSQAVAFPSCMIQPMLQYLPTWEAAHPQHRSAVDYFIGAFCRRERLVLRSILPPVAQHRQCDSLLGHRARYGRFSRLFQRVFGDTPKC